MGNAFGLFGTQASTENEQAAEQSRLKIEHLKAANSNPRKYVVCHEVENKNKLCTARTQCIASKYDIVSDYFGSDLSKSQLEKLKELQANWVELHKCIRFIYKNAISSVPCIVVNEEIPKRITDSIKELIEKLCAEDQQQLFIRLEVLVRDFVLEARDRLKDLQNNVEDIPVLYLRGLLASYSAFCVAADNLAPFLPQLDSLLKKRFSVNFQLLNKHLFQTCLYSDAFVQNNVPLYISQLRTTNSGTHFTNQELIHSYLAFDDEMTDIASRWLDVKKMILKLSKKRVFSNSKQPLLLEDWKLYREHRELAATRTWQLRNVKKDISEFDVQLLSLLDDITSHMCELEISSSMKTVFSTCKNCNTDILCSCDDCTIKHILTCVETPPASPLHNIPENSHPFTQSQILQQFNAATKMFGNCSEVPDVMKTTARFPGNGQKSPESSAESPNKINKIPMPKNFLKLITDKVITKSFVKNCDEENKPDVTDCESTPSRVLATTVVSSAITATSSNATSKVPANTSVAPSITQSPLAAHNQETNTSLSDKQGGTAKESKAASSKAPCSHTYQTVNKKTKETSTTTATQATQACKDNCTDHGHGPVKSNKESKRCDCPHCEVFESTNAQVTGKNNKTRDRLRIRLNEKRNKALKEKNNKAAETTDQNTKSKDSDNNAAESNHPAVGEDTRDIRDLINFIEGTDRNAKLINAQKKLAKKARRRERKLEEERLKEEERQRQEAERLLEEERKLKEKKRLEEAKCKEQAAKGKKNKNQNTGKAKESNKAAKGTSSSKNTSKATTNEAPHYLPPSLAEKPTQTGSPGPMVTIKRVMECTNSEPTVTITLKGSTPDKDKLLYTLVNGQTELARQADEAPFIKPAEMTKKQRKKAKREMQKAAAAAATAAAANSTQQNKKERSNKQKETAKPQIQKSQPANPSHHSSHAESTNKEEKRPVGVQPHQYNNNTKGKPETTLNLQMLRLPPGITITKVDGPAVNRKLRLNTKNSTPVIPPPSPSIQSTDNRSGVIVVDTVKLKEVLPTVEQPAPVTSKKNKKKKNKNKSDNNPVSSPSDIQQNISFSYKISSDVPSAKSSNTGCNSIVTIKNPMFYQLQESLNGKLNKQKVMENQKDTRTQQASIIKGANGMVTIRSPRLNGNSMQCNGHPEPVGPIHAPGNQLLPDLKPVIGPNTSVFKPMKTDNGKPFNAQEILSGLPGIEITKINKNATRTKSECKVFQPADVSIIPTNIANGSNGDVYKLFYDNMDWSLESVFAPKDIKEDEVLDADELELEAFKRFCQQSVPPERKEKVAHLNVKDIVLKKKTSNNVC